MQQTRLASQRCTLAGVFLSIESGRRLEYEKPYMPLDELANRLLARGMIADRDELCRQLNTIGYYRLSGYWYSLKLPDGTFKTGARLSDVIRIYEFDRQLRLCVLDAIERVEVFARARLAHLLARDFGPFGYLKPSVSPA